MDFLDPQCAARSVGPANNLITTFLTTMISIHCNISTPEMWPRDYGETALKYGLDDYDFVIVGAGTAGSVVAGRLAENPNFKILLLEAGNNPTIESEIPGLAFTNFGTRNDWQYETISNKKSCLAQQTEYCYWPKGKLLGGSHGINALLHLRGTSRDFDDWEEQGNPGWGWNDVVEYFRKTENFKIENDNFGYHGTEGPLDIESFRASKFDRYLLLEAARELGYKIIDDFEPGNDLGFGLMPGTLRDGRRMTTAKAFLEARKPNLHVIKNAVATKIDFDKNKTAKQVRFVYKSQYEMKARARNEVILSAGSIETPKLLMLSGIGPRHHLEALGIPVLKNLAVGDNLQDHVRVELYVKLNYTRNLGLDVRMLDDIFNQWVRRVGPYVGSDVTGFIATDKDSRFPEIQYMFGDVSNINVARASFKEFLKESILNQTDPSDRILAPFAILAKPKSRGKIRLRSAYYQDPPIVFPNYLDDYDDIKVIIRGIRKLLEMEHTRPFRNFDAKFLKLDIPECDDYPYNTTKYWRCYVKYLSDTTFHYVGTTKMGSSQDKTSVVDSRLRVRGVKRLRVIDAGVMPTIVGANTNAATAMIAEKGADFLKATWRLDDYDFIVIGAGSAGSVVAGRLAENTNHKILLLEAGGDPPIESEIPGLVFGNFFTQNDWQYETEPSSRYCQGLQRGYCVWNKGKMIGGSHSICAMVYLRGNTRDFDDWESEGNPTWGWNDVLHYFKKTENFTGGENIDGFHGVYGPMNVQRFRYPKIDRFMVLQAAEELGYREVEDFVPGSFLGFGIAYGTLIDGRRMSTAKAFLSEPKSNLHVIKNAVATRIKFSRNRMAESVEFVYKGKYRMEARARKEVILSAGSIGSPQLLMLSGIGPKTHLEALGIPVLKDLSVGNNLQDHVRVDFYLKLKYKGGLTMDKRILDAIYRQWIYRDGWYGAMSLDAVGFLDTDKNGYFPDIQIVFGPFREPADLLRDLQPAIRESILSRIDASERLLRVYVILLKPKSRGKVRLQSPYSQDPPRIFPNYFDAYNDVKTVIRGINRLLRFETTRSFEKFNAQFMRLPLPECDVSPYKSDDYWRCYIKYMTNTFYHTVGTSKMGPSWDKNSVVSYDLKVHGVKRLRVVDASVMPTIVSANVNAATIMIAEKASSFIKHAWR